MLRQYPDAIAAAKKGEIPVGNLRHQAKHGRFYLALDEGFCSIRVTDTARTATHDHTAVVIQRDSTEIRLLIEPDTVGCFSLQTCLGKDGFVFVVRGDGFRSQLQDKERFHAVHDDMLCIDTVCHAIHPPGNQLW